MRSGGQPHQIGRGERRLRARCGGAAGGGELPDPAGEGRDLIAQRQRDEAAGARVHGPRLIGGIREHAHRDGVALVHQGRIAGHGLPGRRAAGLPWQGAWRELSEAVAFERGRDLCDGLAGVGAQRTLDGAEVLAGGDRPAPIVDHCEPHAQVVGHLRVVEVGGVHRDPGELREGAGEPFRQRADIVADAVQRRIGEIRRGDEGPAEPLR